MRQEKDMGFKSSLGIKGLFHARLLSAYNEDGSRYREHGRFAQRLLEERIVHNTVTQLGDAHVADAMSDQAEGALGFMGIGTGSGQGAADVGLLTPLARNALTSTTQGAGAADNDVVFVGTWAAGDGTGAITEAGILLGDNNTSMNYYADFAVVNKAAGDSLTITWTVTYGAS